MNATQRRTLTRLLTAAGLSLSCYGLTSYWYHLGANTSTEQDPNQKTIAFAQNPRDEIHRRPATRLIWQMVSEGEPLHVGETIRTSPAGEVRIQFAEGGRFIDLEPDSLIAINQDEKGLAIDLMDGSFLVNQGSSADQDGPQLSLNTAKGKIDLSAATASLSKSTSGSIDLQVFKGKAKIQSNGQTKEIGSGKSEALGAEGARLTLDDLQILSPALEAFVNPENLQPVLFKWKGFPENTVVTLQMGPTQKKLKDQVSATESMTYLKLSPAKYYWKLVAKNKETKEIVNESPLYRLEVKPRFAPTMILPLPDALLVPTDVKIEVEFKWSVPDKVKSVYLEVAKDSAMKEKIYSKNFFTEASTRHPFPKGEYFWRVSAIYEGIEAPIAAKAQKFSVGNPKPVLPPIAINWLDLDGGKPQYFLEQPLASFGWTSEQKEQVKIWRLKIAQKAEDLKGNSAKTFVTKEASSKTKLEKPGRYIAMVEALDEHNEVLAQSPLKMVDVLPLPLLPAPKFIPLSGDMNANNDGRLEVSWTPIDGAKEYQLLLMESGGKPLRTAKFTQTTTALVNMLPGKYQITIAAIDEYGRLSEKDPPRLVIVPEESSIAAPKMKKIKVN